ncbi:unnamed protein product [Blepharisma stoltei]|uniref:Uncharacterized protein n=1 Tax=Blepharisma stoltei TaxID=1481888 RepID=A0AAU9JPY7_9CILI|nr:unnamed protein product [Blepharisma stoltei]
MNSNHYCLKINNFFFSLKIAWKYRHKILNCDMCDFNCMFKISINKSHILFELRKLLWQANKFKRYNNRVYLYIYKIISKIVGKNQKCLFFFEKIAWKYQ